MSFALHSTAIRLNVSLFKSSIWPSMKLSFIRSGLHLLLFWILLLYNAYITLFLLHNDRQFWMVNTMISEQSFYMVGGIEEVVANAEKIAKESAAWFVLSFLLSIISNCSFCAITVKAMAAVHHSLNDPFKNLSNWKKSNPCLFNWIGVNCIYDRNYGYQHILELYVFLSLFFCRHCISFIFLFIYSFV